MSRLTNILLFTIALSLVALAIGQHNAGQVIAQVIHPVTVVNRKQQPVPVVQASQWEYKTAFCVGPRPNCYSGFTADGLEGWELVSVSPAHVAPGNPYMWDFVFKRPKL